MDRQVDVVHLAHDLTGDHLLDHERDDVLLVHFRVHGRYDRVCRGLNLDSRHDLGLVLVHLLTRALSLSGRDLGE